MMIYTTEMSKVTTKERGDGQAEGSLGLLHRIGSFLLRSM